MLIHYTVGKAENLCVKRDIVNVFINRTAVLKENFAVSDKTLDKNIIFVIINVKIQFDFLTVNQERKAICSQNTVI
ncbi:TPA: hypothetical protein WIZ05_001232 [Neisseria meningitidis]|uniref:Uncharacterized protein n=7 Tax=Neisseria meningitidis TaxID=487 RepID=A0A0H5QDZ5_NEIMI|nr:hypothetical protein [Neisseria meningitidis]ABX73154.1 conserved hypothetical protein [Neisseria meningitidis 053442]EFM04444.1 hypothetical protein HMPREF0602_1076 [Neisseria meningitidis ATCC 13091]EFV63728.1 hypothetical protein NMH_1364 [Neisseria meningitidis H44/76]KER39674.1 hypothetical protein F528_1352 [Neisseria meningitidis 992008]CAM08445.1 hypothetical protein NMA1257 [Neisseria meningitidis Z2491]CAM10284.1 hypothetical protein NMC1020 [Neisseria meningitidis FAM18]CBA0577